MGEAPRLSDRFTLLVPVDPAGLGLLDPLHLGGLLLRPKIEHHLTVFNYPIGKLLRKACTAAPALRGAIDAAAAAVDWSHAPEGVYVHLEKTLGLHGKEDLHTIIARVAAPVAPFFASARALVAAACPPGEVGDLLAALESPPPPHITLYTNDPDRKEGIGLNRAADLEAALARAKGGGDGVRATLLGPDVRVRGSRGPY